MSARIVLPLLLFAGFLAGCSNSWREGDAARSPGEISSMLDEVQSAQGQSLTGSDVGSAMGLRTKAQAIYFAEAPGNLGPVGSILSLVDFSFLGLTSGTIKQVRIFFFDAAPNYGLVIGIDQGSGLQYSGFSGTGDIQDKVMQANLGQITVQSDDVDGDVLNDVIQMHVYLNAGYIGKFSTLVGYLQ